MKKFSYRYLVSTLLLGFIILSAAYSLPYVHAKAALFVGVHPPISPGNRFSARIHSSHVVNMRYVPHSEGEIAEPLLQPRLSTDTSIDAQLLAKAASNQNVPLSLAAYLNPTIGSQTQAAFTGFPGLSQTCCQPPDIALATSPQWIIQAVNRQVAVFNSSGQIEQGWPKSLSSFFSIPDPGKCTKSPFVSAPRASYDVNAQHFWLAAIEDEGLNNSCPFKSLLWVAVSQSSDPNSSWHIYTFNMASGTSDSARFTQFAVDQQAIYFSANMYGNSGRGDFQYSEIFASLKAPLLAGRSDITYYGFVDQEVGNLPADTIQPVQMQENRISWPQAGFFVNSFNIRYGGKHCVNSCSGIVVWSLRKPGLVDDELTGVVVPSLKYALAPLANQPGCSRCFARKSPPDTRISATPIFHSGLLSFALVTALKNRKAVVPGIYWGQIVPHLNDDGTLISASMYQSGYFNFANDEAALYPSLAVNNAGDLFMLYDYTSSKLQPGTAVAMRRVTFQAGRFHDGGTVLRAGATPTVNVDWGNYTATSYEGLGSDKLWFAGQYSDAHHNWATYLARN